MSLQVWLPLTKDLRNQGLNGIPVISTGAINLNDSGKLGKCYKTSNTGVIDLKYTGAQINTGSISLCGWFKFNKSELAATWSDYSFDNTHPYPTGNLIGNNSYGGVGLIWSTNSLASGATFTSLYVACSIRSTVNGARITNAITIPFDTWVHLALIFNKATKALELWMNGELKITNTMLDFNDARADNLKLNYNAVWGGNGPSYCIPFYVNDIRIYDHCLSPMEAKQISQGLVLHYPLDNNGVGGENILVNTSFQSQYVQSTGWDTTKNGTQLANSWGGYNAGVTNASTVYHAHLKELNGEWVYEYIRTANESWLGISQGGLNSKLTAGKTYTFSWEEYRVEGNNYSVVGLYYYKTGATSANFHLGQFGGSSGNILGKWRKFSYTFIAPTDGDYSKNMSWYIYGMSGGIGKMYIRHPKLEEGAKPTPWCPNSSDTLYTTLGYNDNIEYDTSGFGNNGERIGDFSWSSDTPRYLASTSITPNCNIQFTPMLAGADSWTIAAWIKPTVANNDGKAWFSVEQDTYWQITCYSNQLTIRDNSIGGTGSRKSYSFGTIVANTWVHLVATYDNGTLKLYNNGVLQNTHIVGGTYLNAMNNGRWGSAVQGGYYWNGQISDARIYTTALSASDVLSLYQNSAYIDSSGNVYGAVHTEV